MAGCSHTMERNAGDVKDTKGWRSDPFFRVKPCIRNSAWC